MTSSIALVAVIGSLRADSFNRVVFDAATELLGPDVALREVSLRDVPLYDGDLEAAGDPDAVAALKDAVRSADGLLIFTPEYNWGVPAVAKNAIDWLSRMPGDSALTDACVGVVAASPGRGDGANVRRHLSDSLAVAAGRFFPETLGIASVSRKIDDGRLHHPETLESLRVWLGSFVDHVRTPAEVA